MRTLVRFSCVVTVLLHLALCIRLPGQNVTKTTLTTLGIKTLDWQGEDESYSPQVHVHHNYSKVTVQNQAVSSYSQSQSSNSQGKITPQSSFGLEQHQGQQFVDEDDYVDLTSQTQDTSLVHGKNQQSGGFSQTQQTDSFPSQTPHNIGQQRDSLDLEGYDQFSHDNQLLVQSQLDQKQESNSHSSQATFEGQQVDDGFDTESDFGQNQQLQSSLGDEEENDYGKPFTTASSYDNNQIYNAHGYGNRLELDQVMEAENINQQQFKDFPDYDIGQLQVVDQTAEASDVVPEERQAKHFYPVDKPMYIHGYKYPPDPANVSPSNRPTPTSAPEIHTECPKMTTGQFVHPASCNQFLNCWKGRGFVQNCAPGTLFNPKTLECDFASKVQCITGPRKPEQNKFITGQKLEISCPAEYSGVVPHHTDCSKFINCANGVENVMDCPPGTLFSVKINNCDFPYKTECASWSVQFGNIKDYSWPSGSHGESSGSYQGQTNFNAYGQNSYLQSGNNRYDKKYTSSYDFRLHQGYGTGNKINQNQDSWTASHGDAAGSGNGAWTTSTSGSTSQQNLHGQAQGSSSSNKNFYEQNVFGTGQNTVSEGGNRYGGGQQTNHGSSQGLYNSGHSQGGYGQHQVSGQNLQGTTSQGVAGFGNHQGSFTGGQNTHSQSSSDQDINVQGGNYYDQNQDLPGAQTTYGTNQQSYGNKNVHTENQNYYNQNQDLLGSQSQYLHGQNQQLSGHPGQYQDQNYDGQEQGQYHYGGHSLHEGQTTVTNVQQGVNKDTLSSNKFSGVKAKCPSGESGLFPHPSDCSKFLNCASGQTFVQDCGPGTVFNPNLKVCDHPHKVNCQQTEDYHHLINVRTETKPPTNQATGSHGYYTSQNNAEQNIGTSSQSKFGQNGYGSVQNQGYGVGGNKQTSSSVYQETLGSGSSPKGQGYYSNGSQKSTFESRQLVKCPERANGLYPHPTICSKFLNCGGGQTLVQDCSPGTVFNPTIKACDSPHKVKCQHSEGYHLANVNQGISSHGYSTSQGSNYQNSGVSGQWNVGQNPYGSEQNQGYGVGSNTQTSSGVYHSTGSSSKKQDHYSSIGEQKSTIKSEEEVKCPEHASGLYPHPWICSKFLNCGSGQTFIQDCGPGTVFNPTSKVCDFPYNVECGSTYGEGLINIRQFPSINKTENTQTQGWYSNIHQEHSDQNQSGGSSGGKPPQHYYGQGEASNWNLNVHDRQPGSYDQNSIGSSTENQGEFHGQSSGSHTSNQGVSSGTGQDFYTQNSGINKQQGSYGQKQSTSGSNTNQEGYYGQGSVTSSNHQQSYDHKHVGSSSSVGEQGTLGINSKPEGSYNQHQIGSSSAQGSYGTSSAGSQGHYDQSQTGGPTWVNKNQQSFVGQNKIDEDQELQESKNYNQQFYGSNQVQNVNKQESRTRNPIKHHHSPPPFPSTDINADYEFGNEDATLEVGAIDFKPKPPNSKRKDFCEPSDFHCNVDDCIPQSMVCDGVKDCPNGLDEKNCGKYLNEFAMTPNTILAVREKERYLNISLVYCAKICLEAQSFQCKSFSYRKDDGGCFLSDTNVGNSGALIISHPYNYFEVKSFSVDCSSLYKCPSQKCITFKQVCDGINDCGDRTDEKGCSAEAFGYQIRLGGTEKKHEGRIELKAFGKWGYICDDKFGLRDADVVCRELGFPLGSLEVKANSYYAQDLSDEDVFYLMDDVTCLGNETTVRDCDFNGWGVNNCESQEIVGIVCKTPLENCPKDYWKCDSSHECIPLSFVCDEVFDCTDQSDEKDHHCEAPIEVRLANGKTKYEGRIEVRYHGIWGTVCDDDFNDDSAKVVCKQLGYPGQAFSKKDGYFGPGTGPIWLDQVFCQGNESSLEHCIHWNWGEHNCEHAEDVGVICSNTYDDIGSERNVKLDQKPQVNEVLPEYLFPERCGLRKDDQFLEDDAVHFRVVKGSGAKKGDYPWQASLRIKNKAKSTHWCGAVVISQKFVLTAAHCLAGFAKGAYFIVAGDYNTDDDEGTEQEAYIEEFYIHEEFRSGHKMNNDVAVIKLKGKGLTFTKDVQPICLPEADVEYAAGLNCTISGFGSIESGKSGYSHTLRAGWVPLQSREVCQMPHVYGSTLTDGMFCAGSLDEGIDACDGDSGGPLACLHDGLFTLYGLTSWGHHCGYANKPGVYAKVSHYRKWIDETIMKHS